MSGRKSYEIKRAILGALKDGKSHTYAQLEKKIGGNWLSIRDHCTELEIFNCIIVTERQSHERNNKPYHEISITSFGHKALEKLKNISS